MTATIHHGDALEVLRSLPSNSFHGSLSDPPYELSNDRKASAISVALELMFPKYSDVKSDQSGRDCLPLLISKVLLLGVRRNLPTPAAAMPVSPVALNRDSARRDEDVKDVGEGAICTTDGVPAFNLEAKLTEHLGDFALECADPVAMHKALDRVGTGFLSGGIGIGLRVAASTLPDLLRGCCSVDVGDEDVRRINDAITLCVGAFSGAEGEPVASPLSPAWRDEERLPAGAAAALLGTLKLGGARAVRTGSRACRLPAKLQSRRISVVDNATGDTVAFNLVLHPVSVTTTGFMGNSWDGSKVAYDVAIWREVLRCLKPGAHLLAFGGTRTFHRLTCAIEDAGFEIRDCMSWLYGSGFPKSHNGPWGGTALKPAWEPIIVARKPLVGTVAANVQEYGCGGLAIDACRIESGPDHAAKCASVVGLSSNESSSTYGAFSRPREDSFSPLGRWPANVILDEEAGAALDQQSGNRPGMSGGGKHKAGSKGGMFGAIDCEHTARGDNGGASRFFYCAKASRAERDAGLHGFDPVQSLYTRGTGLKANGDGSERSERSESRNIHPTVKPIALARYLARLILPPIAGTRLLNPFSGSGSEAIGALLAGWSHVDGIDSWDEAVRISRARISHWAKEAA